MTDTATLRSQLLSASNPNLKRVLARKLSIASLKDQISACTNCPLHESAIQSVPIDGPTHGSADLMLVGEAPGFNEDKYGRPFIGKSGAVLDRIFELVGTKRERVVVLNTLAHRPPNNRDPKPEELAACRPWFEKQLDLAGMWIGVALGGYALASVMGVSRSSIRIGDYLDKPVWVNGRVWFGTYHPSYALRNPSARYDISLSIRAALALRRGDKPLPITTATNQTLRDEETLHVLKSMNILDDPSTAEHLHKKGWVLGYSEALGEKIVVIGGEDIYRKKGIPAALKDYPRWTVNELLRIGEAGSGRTGWTKEQLRTLAMVRDEFRGEVVA